MLAARSRLHYPFSEILNLDGRLVTRINTNYLKIAMWLAHDAIILSHKSFGRDQQETFFTFAPLAKWYVNVSFVEGLILKDSYD